MRHFVASRLLAQLPDHTLPGPVELALRAHTERCQRCRRRLADFALCERLLARLPAGVVPLDAAGDERLAGLARWACAAPAPLRLRVEGLALAAAAAAMAGVVALAGTTQWIPTTERTPSAVTQVAYVLPVSARVR